MAQITIEDIKQAISYAINTEIKPLVDDSIKSAINTEIKPLIDESIKKAIDDLLSMIRSKKQSHIRSRLSSIPSRSKNGIHVRG